MHPAEIEEQKARKNFIESLNAPPDFVLEQRTGHCLSRLTCDHEWCRKYRCFDYRPKHSKNAKILKKLSEKHVLSSSSSN